MKCMNLFGLAFVASIIAWGGSAALQAVQDIITNFMGLATLPMGTLINIMLNTAMAAACGYVVIKAIPVRLAFNQLPANEQYKALSDKSEPIATFLQYFLEIAVCLACGVLVVAVAIYQFAEIHREAVRGLEIGVLIFKMGFGICFIGMATVTLLIQPRSCFELYWSAVNRLPKFLEKATDSSLENDNVKMHGMIQKIIGEEYPNNRKILHRPAILQLKNKGEFSMAIVEYNKAYICFKILSICAVYLLIGDSGLTWYTSLIALLWLITASITQQRRNYLLYKIANMEMTA